MTAAAASKAADDEDAAAAALLGVADVQAGEQLRDADSAMYSSIHTPTCLSARLVCVVLAMKRSTK